MFLAIILTRSYSNLETSERSVVHVSVKCPPFLFSQPKQLNLVPRFDFKYLGIVLDDSLMWKDHVRYVISYKVGKRVGVLWRLRRNITIHAAFEMYNSLILPIFDYCDVVWSAAIKQIWKVLNLCKGGPRKL